MSNVNATKVLKTAQRASLAELDALFVTLQHCAFKGEFIVSSPIQASTVQHPFAQAIGLGLQTSRIAGLKGRDLVRDAGDNRAPIGRTIFVMAHPPNPMGWAKKLRAVGPIKRESYPVRRTI